VFSNFKSILFIELNAELLLNNHILSLSML